MQKDKYYTINSLAKAFDVIELMSCKDSWRLHEIALASKLPKGTLQRILLTLCELGFVTQEGKGGLYSLTLEFYKIGKRVASNNKIVDKAKGICRQLMEHVNETVNLCVLHGTEMVVIEQQVSFQLLRLDSIVGSAFPVFASASGKAYCAFLEERQLMNILKSVRELNPNITGDHVQNFLEELKDVRRTGLGHDNEEIFPGVRCLAAPVFDYSGNVVATIGCSVPTVRLDEAKMQQMSLEIARATAKISKMLGAPDRNFEFTTH